MIDNVYTYVSISLELRDRYLSQKIKQDAISLIQIASNISTEWIIWANLVRYIMTKNLLLKNISSNLIYDSAIGLGNL